MSQGGSFLGSDPNGQNFTFSSDVFVFGGANKTGNSKKPTNPQSKTLPKSKVIVQPPKSTQTLLSLPPWKTSGPISNTTTTDPTAFRTSQLTTHLGYIKNILDRSLRQHNWPVAHQCILKLINSFNRHIKNTEFITDAIISVPKATNSSNMLTYLQIDLLRSHIRLQQYDEAWEVLTKLDFMPLDHPLLVQTAYREATSAVGFLDQFFKIPTAGQLSSAEETEARNGLLSQAEMACKRAIDAATDGNVMMYCNPMRYELYGLMAVIKREQEDLENATFWKSLVLADGVFLEKNLAVTPFLLIWIGNYESIRDSILDYNSTVKEWEEEEETSVEPQIRKKDIPVAGPENTKPKSLEAHELRDTLKEMRNDLTTNLNQMRAVLKQGLQDLKNERQEIEELKNEIEELKLEMEVEIDIVRDELYDLRDEFGDKLLEELQEGLDPEATVGLRLESVAIANKRVGDLNREVEARLNDLKAELKLDGTGKEKE
ncbi:hypothetical protein TWF730_002112 [Orbilia blumenaviensis]|uniref:Uncharacterized protein n=1 Tax=Orbilia blumenaviensis TaxID=1796055 RepID=A0AAV9UHA0_9PEZI